MSTNVQVEDLTLESQKMASIRGGGSWYPMGARVRCMGKAGCGLHARLNKHWHNGRDALVGQAKDAEPQVAIRYVYFDNRGLPTNKVRFGPYR